MSILQAEELSITVVPTSAKRGAHSREVLPPAEKSAKSGFWRTASSRLTTSYSLSLKEIIFPTDLSEATGSSSVTGKFLSASTFNITWPTIPVAPTTAIFIQFKVFQKVSFHSFRNLLTKILRINRTETFPAELYTILISVKKDHAFRAWFKN